MVEERRIEAGGAVSPTETTPAPVRSKTIDIGLDTAPGFIEAQSTGLRLSLSPKRFSIEIPPIRSKEHVRDINEAVFKVFLRTPHNTDWEVSIDGAGRLPISLIAELIAHQQSIQERGAKCTIKLCNWSSVRPSTIRSLAPYVELLLA